MRDIVGDLSDTKLVKKVIRAKRYEFFSEAACISPFRTYLAVLDGTPVVTSQLFTSAGVAEFIT